MPHAHTPALRRLAAALAVAALAVTLSGCLTTNQTKMVDLINASRRGAGLSSMSPNQAATDKAQAWAAHMSRTGRLEHSGGTRMDTSGLPTWCAAGENVAKASTIDHAHSLLMRSASHKANILGRFNRVGTGVVRSGSYVWVVQIFYRTC